MSILHEPNEGAGEERSDGPAELPWPGIPVSLRVADGFKFGCGLMLAGATALALILLFVSVAFLAARFSGNDISLPTPPTTVEPR